MKTGKSINEILIRQVGDHFDISDNFRREKCYDKMLGDVYSDKRCAINAFGIQLNRFFQFFIRSEFGRRI